MQIKCNVGGVYLIPNAKELIKTNCQQIYSSMVAETDMLPLLHALQKVKEYLEETVIDENEDPFSIGNSKLGSRATFTRIFKMR